MPIIHTSQYHNQSVTAPKLKGGTSTQIPITQADGSVAYKTMSGAATITTAGVVALSAGTVAPGTVANTTPAAPGALTAAMVGVPVTVQFVIPDAASGNVDFTGFPYKMRVTSVDYIKTGGAGNAGNSIAMHNGTGGNAITNAMNNATDTGTSSAATIDDAFWDIAVGATVRFVTVRAGGNNAAVINVTGIRIA